MFKNATFLSFYFADNQLFSNSETLVSNYTNHIFHTEVDPTFKIREWKSFKAVRNFTNIFRK
jgi:hypothetical protein